MNRTAGILATITILAGGSLSACSGEAESIPYIDTAATAQTKLQKGDYALAYVVLGMVSPVSKTEGKTTIYNPLRLDGSNAYWYAACKGGNIMLKQLVESPGTIYYPRNVTDRFFERKDMPEAVARVVLTAEPCGINAPDLPKQFERVAYLDSPVVE